jgi:hypothetical protein
LAAVACSDTRPVADATGVSVIMANQVPLGSVEAISGGTITGWACDPDQPTQSVQVHFYADHTWDGGTILGGAVANQPSDSSINAACGGGTAHRFTFTVPTAEKSRIGPGTHPVYSYAIDLAGGANPLLPGSPRQLAVTGQKNLLNRGANINHNCRYYQTGSWNQIQPPQGTCPGDRYWNIRGTNEDSGFNPAGWFLPNDPALTVSPGDTARRAYSTYAFNAKGDGTYQIGWVVDKVSFPQDLNRYSGAFVNDVLFNTPPALDANVFIDLRMGLFGMNQVNDATVGLAKNRTTMGILAYWNDASGAQQTQWVEINLFRTSNFDLCTGTCDPKGIYDRHSDYGNGEIIYYDVNTMYRVAGYPQTGLTLNQTLKDFTIPVATLFRKYAWARPPASGWNGVTIAGIYIGHEIWGRGRVWVEFDNYRVYSFTAT